MRVAFADFSGWDIHAGSVGSLPLGGSQSAACYLAQEMATSGDDIFFVSQTSDPGVHAGVTCLSWAHTPLADFASLQLDAFICILGAGNGALLRTVLGPATRLLLWTQHRCDQAAVQTLAQPAERNSYDAYIFVSEWQRAEFVSRFAIARHFTHVLRNAVAPAFEELIPETTAISSAKAHPPTLAYTSTPFRGLDLLLDAFPLIRQRVPEVRLRVFSSMKVYQVPAEADAREYGTLYERCRHTEGVEYVGSLPQAELAREMRTVTALAYPNTFPETSCIAVLEALAAGCQVITSELGALPETAAGFARLIPVSQTREAYLQDFAVRCVEALRQMSASPGSVEEQLRAQIRHIRENATWSRRAREWRECLGQLCQQSATR